MIFISYSKKDIQIANEIVDLLKSLGFEYWIDYVELDLNQNVEKQLELAIKNAEYFILISTENSSNSVWVDIEYRFAKKYITKNKIIKVDSENFKSIERKLAVTMHTCP